MSIVLKSEPGDSSVAISITGRFDFGMNSEFRKVLNETDGANKSFLIDMSGVEDIDSSALGMLLLLREKAGGDSSNIKITKCRPDIVDILKMANFHTMFTIS